MKIQRLLSIVNCLLNRELISASELSEKFNVTVRTIQRDIDILCSAGIPVSSTPGSKGGYGIIEGYRIDRQLINTEDLFFLITSLESIKATSKRKDLDITLDKIKSLTNVVQQSKMELLKEKFFIDFSSLSVERSGDEKFQLLEKAVNEQKVISFNYNSPDGDSTNREIEPLTIAFKWYSWYIYGFCLKRNDYRLFRISRMQNIDITAKKFIRREQTFQDYLQKAENSEFSNTKIETIILKFSPSVKTLVKDYFRDHNIMENPDGSQVVEFITPVSNWVYGMILSYGSSVEVISPLSIRQKIREQLQEISSIYKIN